MLDSMRLVFAAIGISASGVWMLGGAAQEPINFDLPAGTVIERLNASHRTVEGTGMGSLTLSGEEQFIIGKAKIGVLRAGSVRKVFCTVEVEATAQTTSAASLDCTQPDSDGSAARKLAGEALRIVVEEHVVASALGRRYDTGKVADRMIAFMTRSAPLMAASMQRPEPKPGARPQPAPQAYEADMEPFDSEDSGGEDDASEPADFGDDYEFEGN